MAFAGEVEVMDSGGNEVVSLGCDVSPAGREETEIDFDVEIPNVVEIDTDMTAKLTVLGKSEGVLQVSGVRVLGAVARLSLVRRN